MPKIKITKKKLKEPDEFISFADKGFLFLKEHSRKITRGGIVLILIILSVFLYYRWEKGNEEEASLKFSLAMETFQGVNAPLREGPPENVKDLVEKFDEVIVKFPRTSPGKLSFLFKGNLQLRLGDFEGAVKSYETFLEKGGKEKSYRIFALEGLGYAYEGKKEYEKALQAYQKTLEAGGGFRLANGYAGAGRCYERLGKNKEALESYRAFLKV
ncbi:MAG: hypothetical protein A2170_12245, partial [Deltaproteobacteria bacterium RBG_13_53_10]